MSSSRFVRGALLLSALALLSCDTPAATESAAESSALAHAGHGPALVRGATEFGDDLAELRALTARFHDFDAAVAAGYSVQITPCLELPPLGAMGFHYGNPALIDAEVALLEPELLLYEPQKNGKLRFVGVEYIVPWTFIPATAPAPVLPELGLTFTAVPDAQLWGLHIYVARNNPSGIFADWNPKVSCQFAE
jgi:hypothetical protein